MKDWAAALDDFYQILSADLNPWLVPGGILLALWMGVFLFGGDHSSPKPSRGDLDRLLEYKRHLKSRGRQGAE